MGLNEVLFGGLAIIGILIFLFFGQFRASKSQRNRKGKIRWNTRMTRNRKR